MATDRHPGTTATPGGFKATGFVASKPGDALNVNPAPGINWLQKYGEMDWGNALKTGDFGLTDAERATQLANTVRINNEEMAKAQAARAAAAQVSQAPPRMPAPIQGPMRQGGSYPYQIPNRTFEWSTTPQEQMALAGRMNRQDLQPLLSSGEYGPLAGQNYRYTPQGTTQINYGPGGGYGGGYGWPTGGWPTGGWPTGGYPTGGTPTGGTPTGGTPTGGTPTGGTPTGGTPTGVTPTGGTPTGGYPTSGTPTREELFEIFDRNNPGPTTVADIGKVRTDPITGQTITATGISLADAAKNYNLTPEEAYRVTYSPYGAEERGQGRGTVYGDPLMSQNNARLLNSFKTPFTPVQPWQETPQAGSTQQAAILAMENQRRAQAQAGAQRQALEALSRQRAAQQQAVKEAEARRQQFTIRGLGEERGMAAANQALANRQAQQQAAGAAQRVAEQQRVAQAEGQRQRQAEMERRANQQQAQQQAAAVVRQTQQRDRGAEQAKQAREQASRAQESAKRAQEQSRAQAASKAAASRAQQARVEATERSKRESARASQAASQAASRARAAERERATVAASRKTPAPKVTPVSRRTGGKKKVSKAPTRPGGR